MAKILQFPNRTAPSAPSRETDDDEFAEMPDEYWERGARWVLQPRDNSMLDMGITRNDFMFVVPSGLPHDRYPSLCFVNGTPMLKYVEKISTGRFRLRSRREAVPPIEVFPNDDFRVCGHVIGRSGEPLKDEASE